MFLNTVLNLKPPRKNNTSYNRIQCFSRCISTLLRKFLYHFGCSITQTSIIQMSMSKKNNKGYPKCLKLYLLAMITLR